MTARRQLRLVLPVLPVLVARLHVDLRRQAGALCPQGADALR